MEGEGRREREIARTVRRSKYHYLLESVIIPSTIFPLASSSSLSLSLPPFVGVKEETTVGS